jgi:hypothetical protein
MCTLLLPRLMTTTTKVTFFMCPIRQVTKAAAAALLLGVRFTLKEKTLQCALKDATSSPKSHRQVLWVIKMVEGVVVALLVAEVVVVVVVPVAVECSSWLLPPPQLVFTNAR